MDLFDYGLEQELLTRAPLAERMRPRNLEEILGQEEIIGPGSLLRKAIEADNLSSLILHGPPGTGKTTFAKVVSLYTRGVFAQINAVTSGVQELRKLLDEAKQTLGLSGRRTILFIDEIHRYSKNQQDALLPAVEKGIIILIGATTENPYFYLIDPLVSRSLVYKFNSLQKEDLVKIMKKALEDETRGLKKLNPRVREDALDFLAAYSDGDARRALNALEFAVKTTAAAEGEERVIDMEALKASLQKNHLRYDKAGDQHYDIISAFIKSIRGSDPDAAVYWLARMLASGEDPLFICRRLIISASEDVGNADPDALRVAVAVAQAVQFIGMPEGKIPLAQAVTYLASAPKSNAAYKAINKAGKFVAQTGSLKVPLWLRNPSDKGAREAGHGLGYKYPHDYPGGFVKQDYLPQEALGERFYLPKEIGREEVIKLRLDKLKGTKA